MKLKRKLVKGTTDRSGLVTGYIVLPWIPLRLELMDKITAAMEIGELLETGVIEKVQALDLLEWLNSSLLDDESLYMPLYFFDDSEQLHLLQGSEEELKACSLPEMTPDENFGISLAESTN